MNFEAIQHIPMSQQAHGIDPNHVVFRLRAGRDDLKHCTLFYADRPPTSEGGAAAARALLELQTRPNAVICANQYIAFGCVNELKASGIRIPEDMAVITFDDFPFSKIIEPQLSVVNLDMYDMGEAGCESCSAANPDTAVSCTIADHAADIDRTTIDKEVTVKEVYIL